MFPSVFASHSASSSRVSEVSKLVLRFFMMSEAGVGVGGTSTSFVRGCVATRSEN